MKNYICLNGKKVELTAEQVAQLMGKKEKKLREFSPADTFKLGEFEFVVLEHNYRERFVPGWREVRREQQLQRIKRTEDLPGIRPKDERAGRGRESH